MMEYTKTPKTTADIAGPVIPLIRYRGVVVIFSHHP